MIKHQNPHPPWSTIPEMLSAIFFERGAKNAVIDGEVVLSYQEVETLSQILAARMNASGLEPGDRVVIWADNCWEWVVSVIACWWGGCVAVPISSKSKFLDILPVVEKTCPKLIFLASLQEGKKQSGEFMAYLLGNQPNGHSSLPTPPMISTFEDPDLAGSTLPSNLYVQFPSRQASGHRMTEPALVSGNDICEILFTSGSSGVPKGVPCRHVEILGNRWASSISRGFSGEDVLLALPDFAHTLGLNGILLRSFLLGATVVTCTSTNITQRAELIQRHNVTALIGPPSLFDALLMAGSTGAAALSSVRLVSIGSDAIRPELVTKLLEAGVESIASGYGMTECGSISSAVQTMGADAVANTVGKPEFGIEVQVVDDADNPLPPGKTGEIWVKGYCVSGAYFEDETQSAEAYTADGWLRTGDLGCWTSEGLLQITGRKKDVIIVHGYTVFPGEVERLLMESSMLQGVGVVGIHSAFSGQECVAFVIPNAAEQFDVRAFRVWAKDNIAAYKIPTRILVKTSLPLNRNGKLDRLALKNSLNRKAHM